jgi:hypothetical protein
MRTFSHQGPRTDRCGTDIIDTRAQQHCRQRVTRPPIASSADAAAAELGVTDLLVFKTRFAPSKIRD